MWLLDLLHPYVQVKLVWMALLLLDGVYKLRCVHPFLWFIRLSYVASSLTTTLSLVCYAAGRVKVSSVTVGGKVPMQQDSAGEVHG